jgi:hypothetical protein
MFRETRPPACLEQKRVRACCCQACRNFSARVRDPIHRSRNVFRAYGRNLYVRRGVREVRDGVHSQAMAKERLPRYV